MRLLLLAAVTLAASAAHAQPRFAVDVAGQGPHVVLVPGLASGPSTWNETVPALDGHTVHRLTLAGFAGVPRVEADAEGDMLDAVRDEIAAYVAGLDGPAVVVGHSLGGFLALRTAALQPDNLAGVVVVDAAAFLPMLWTPGEPDLDAIHAQFEVQRAAMVAMTPGQVRAQQAAVLPTLVRDSADVAELLADNAQSDPTTIFHAIVDLTTTDARSDVAQIDVPALVVLAGGAYARWGMASEDAVRALYAPQYGELEGGQVEVVPDALHFIMRDEPEAFNGLLTGFLSRTLSTTG